MDSIPGRGTNITHVTWHSKLLLKNEVADRLNQILGAPRVTRVYFTEFVIQ